MTHAVDDTPLLDQALIDGILARAASPDFDRFEAQLRSSNNCERPVRLEGHVATPEGEVVWSTADEPNGQLIKACGNRRRAACEPCSFTYSGDAYHLVLAGVRGGKGVPESVGEHPVIFATLTAPSFGVVHSQRRDKQGRPLRCRPRRDAEVCPHGVRMSCGQVHDEADPCLGESLCPECYDYPGAVMWNNMIGELWRRTTIYLPRKLAALLGVTQKELRRRVRPAYVKVAEYQHRGLVHVHVLIRLDRAMPTYRSREIRPPAATFTAELLAQGLIDAACDVAVPLPEELGDEHLRWGDELDVHPLDDGQLRKEVAGYLAKYTTKSTADIGGLLHRVAPEDVDRVGVRDHMRGYLRAAFDLNEQVGPKRRLARNAHQLGYRGHCLTKSHRYSTTFKALREARERQAHEQLLKRRGIPESQRRLIALAKNDRITSFRYAGSGHFTTAEEFLARSAHARALEERQAAREARWMEGDHENAKCAPAGASGCTLSGGAA